MTQFTSSWFSVGERYVMITTNNGNRLVIRLTRLIMVLVLFLLAEFDISRVFEA